MLATLKVNRAFFPDGTGKSVITDDYEYSIKWEYNTPNISVQRREARLDQWQEIDSIPVPLGTYENRPLHEGIRTVHRMMERYISQNI